MYISHSSHPLQTMPNGHVVETEGTEIVVDEDEFMRISKEFGIVADGFKRETDTEDDENRFLRQNRPETLVQISAARDWLRKYQRRNSLNRSTSTDVLQVRCSAASGLSISHGALLVALYLEGMQVKRCTPSSRDAWTNISFKLAAPIT